jgi:signal transduction histidine kinase
MENWMIISRLVILLYCLINYIREDMNDIPTVILFALAYISTVMLSYILRRKLPKQVFQGATIIISIIGSYLASPLMLLLIPVDILEFVSGFTQNNKILIIAVMIPALIYRTEMLPLYILTGFFCFCVFLLSHSLSYAQSSYKAIKEGLKEKNEELRNKLELDSEYKAQIRYLSQLEERNSLAQKIHDRVGHTIAGSIIQLEAAELILGKDAKKAGAILSNVTLNLKEGMDNIRSTLRAIKPAPEQLGINRLKVMIDEFSLNSSIKTSFSYKGNFDVVSHLQWKIITDNIKESLTNALKYSSATSVDIRLELMNRLIKAEVRDNGKGALTIKKGIGLTGMEERTESAGGQLIIDGSCGFSVITILPVEEVSNVYKSVDSR